jgi:hypothetical protein
MLKQIGNRKLKMEESKAEEEREGANFFDHDVEGQSLTTLGQSTDKMMGVRVRFT